MSEPHPAMSKVGPDGKCVLTGHPCTCLPKTGGHWCCWSIPKEEVEQAPSVEQGKAK